MEDDESLETARPKKPVSAPAPVMTLQKAVEMGEYDPEYLATFPEWHTLTRHIQWEYIRQAIDNRQRQLDLQLAAVMNVLDFSKKPHLQDAIRGIQEQTEKIREDREKLLMEYSKP